jgi:hypothetical protein
MGSAILLNLSRTLTQNCGRVTQSEIKTEPNMQQYCYFFLKALIVRLSD